MLAAYYLITVPIFKFVCWRLGLRVEGAENIPRSGPLLLVGKHQREADGVWAIGSIPRATRIMIKDDANWPTKTILKLLAAMYTVKRGSRDLKAYRQTLRNLQKGRAVVMFPEGHRSRELIGFHTGVASIARRIEGVRIVPFAVFNSENLGVLQIIRHLFKGPPACTPTIRFGVPFVLATTTHQQKRVQRLEDIRLIRSKVAALMPSELIGSNELYKVAGKTQKSIIKTKRAERS